MEIIITLGIIAVAVFILFKQFKNKRKGQCSCGSCTSMCPHYKKK